MPRRSATRRASSTASLPQHEPKRETGSGPSRRPHTRIVTPTAAYPASTTSAAATEESTPPLIPTTMRSRLITSVSRADQHGQPLELVGVGIRDLDAPLALAADDAHAGHERALQSIFERGQLGRAPALLGSWRAAGGGRAHGVLGGAHRPVVGEDFVA